MHLLRSVVIAALIATPLFAADPIPAAVKKSFGGFNADAIRAHDRFLSSDLLEGRGPGTRGDALATSYIATRFEAMGLAPLGDNGTFFQKVPLLGVQLDPATTSVTFKGGNGRDIGPLKYLDEYVGSDQTQNTSGTLDSEVIFVGHGVVAPEANWDDYKGLDVKGKTLVMLVDDPPANEKEPDLFGGKARTYYGRWTYKYEIGTAKGAQAVILIHTNDAAGYGWQVVRNSWGRERSYTKNAEGANALRFAGWITEAIADELFKAAGQDRGALTAKAATRDFKPVSLGFRFTGTVASKIRPFETNNIVAKLEGGDAKLKDEAILYTAHHDHLGIGTPDPDGDNIYNGAIDNASGVSLLLDLARVWTQASPKPKRSIVFAAVAAEEQGLLGSAWYGQYPTMPAGKIALAINFDSIFEFGPVKDVTMLGVEKMSFASTAEKVAKAMELTIVPDQQPEQGSYYRSDHFSLAKAGVPAFSIDQGHRVVGKPDEWGRKMSDEYRDKHYHQPSDEIDPSWDWRSAVQMGQFGFWLGWEAANAATMPNWNAGTEFRAIRDKSQNK
ncbi:MAG TPA: M28 family peptidase [Thermoanaerobaculia bacterium]|nr:M28 family peptidase [Thermoanaerobaculia bacterium]